jgi:hypothetical protein
VTYLFEPNGTYTTVGQLVNTFNNTPFITTRVTGRAMARGQQLVLTPTAGRKQEANKREERYVPPPETVSWRAAHDGISRFLELQQSIGVTRYYPSQGCPSAQVVE